MVSVERTFTVSRPMSVVVDYLADFANAEAWDPGTVSCHSTSTGPLAVGSRWHNVSSFRGRETELEYELVRYDNDHLTFIGKNRTATSTDDMSFAAAGQGSTVITYRAEVELHGLAKLAGPIVQRAFNGIAEDTVEKMTTTLQGLSA